MRVWNSEQYGNQRAEDVVTPWNIEIEITSYLLAAFLELEFQGDSKIRMHVRLEIRQMRHGNPATMWIKLWQWERHNSSYYWSG